MDHIIFNDQVFSVQEIRAMVGKSAEKYTDEELKQIFREIKTLAEIICECYWEKYINNDASMDDLHFS